MFQKNYYCDQCDQEATVFTLLPPHKVKACPLHSASLLGESPSVFAIEAYDFMERDEDYPEFMRRRNIARKCQGSLTVLQERCESNRLEAHSGLQTTREALLGIVERTIQELQIQVEQRCQRIQQELSGLSTDLGNFLSSKNFALTPTLEAMSKSIPTGSLFRVCVGDCSLQLAKTVLESCVLLPSDTGIPPKNAGKKLLEKVRTVAADLAEEVCAYALDMGQTPNSDYKTAASKWRRKVARELPLALPLTTTEEHRREIVEQYRLAGVGAMEVGDYSKAQKKLKRGWDLLLQWGMESAEMCLQLGAVFANCGKWEEAISMYRRGLQHSSSSLLSLQLRRALMEVFAQMGKCEQVVETGEPALTPQQDSFELLQVLYYLTFAHHQLGNIDRRLELVDYWTREIVVDSVPSKSALQVIYAEKKYWEGSNEEAARLYEEALQSLEILYPNSYFTVYSKYALAWIYTDWNKQEQALPHYVKASTISSVHFPQDISYATCLNNLADLYKSMDNVEAAETQYLKALTIYSTQYPQDIYYGNCLNNLADLYASMDNVEAAETQYLKAITLYSDHFPHTMEYAVCLTSLGNLYQNIGNIGAAEPQYLKALTIYSAHFPQDMNYANSLVNLADLYESMGNVEETETQYLKAITIYSDHYPHTIEYAVCLENFGNLYASMGNVEAAETQYLKAITIHSTHFPQDVSYAMCLGSLGDLYKSMGNVGAAETQYLKGIAIYSAQYPQDSSYTICRLNLGELLSKGEATQRIQAAQHF